MDYNLVRYIIPECIQYALSFNIVSCIYISYLQ